MRHTATLPRDGRGGLHARSQEVARHAHWEGGVIYRDELFVTYSRDRAAVEELAHWQAERQRLPFWKRSERTNAGEMASRARKRCIDAGVDWDRVARPPARFRAPDRSQSPRLGQPSPSPG